MAAAVLISLTAVAAYHNSLGGPFILDDKASIAENPSIRHLWPIGPVLTSARFATVVGRPALNLSLAVNYAVGGTDVWGYHVLNLAVHILAGLVLLGVVRRTLLLPSMPEGVRRAPTALAAAVALLWTVHPLQTASVTYIVQRAESMMGLFYLLTLYGVVRAAGSSRPIGWHVAAVAACLLGMGTKEVVASAPLVVFLYDRVFLTGSFREALRRRWGLYVALAATWVLLAALMLTSGGRERSAGFGYGMTAWEYARTQFGFIVRYLRLAFWPHPLVFDYGTAIAQTAGETVPYAIIVAILLAATVVALRRRPWAGFLGAGFFLILAPTSSIVPLVTQVGAEHRMYLPLAAVVSLVVILAHEGWGRAVPLLARSDAARRRLAQVVPAAALVAVAASLAYVTHLRNQDYRTVVSIWEDTLRKCPENARAHSNLATHFLLECHYGRAIEEASAAIRLRPDAALPYNTRGNAYQQLGRYAEAIADHTRAIALEPDHASGYINRANAYVQVGRYNLALADGGRAIELAPDSPDAYTNRGNAYLLAGRHDLAIGDYNRAIEIDPSSATAYKNRAIACYYLKQYARAWADLKTSLELGARPNRDFIRLLSEASGVPSNIP